MFISYAQNFEDVMLWRALKNVEKGFYIDIGAQDPVADSVSFAFYENGWRGVHVEPVAYYADKLRQARPDETVIQAAVARQSGVLTFFEVEDTGLSTANPQIAEIHRATGYNVRETVVPCLSLFEILEKYQDRDIHWMKIDVEGMEAEVLHGWQSSMVRPWIVVVESMLPNTQVETHGEWEPLLIELGYKFVYFDGLNRFYVHKAYQDLKDKFRYPPNVFDNFALSGTSGVFCSLLNSKLRCLENNLSEMQLEYQNAREDIQQLEKKYKRRESELTTQLNQSREDIQQLEQKYKRRESELTTQLDQSGEENQCLTNALVERDRLINDLQVQTERLKNELDAAKVKIEELNGHAHHWWTVADGLNQELQSVFSSQSWRITKPLRWMNLHFKGILGGMKSLLLYIAGLPRRILRKLLEAGLAHVRRHPEHRARIKRLLLRWPRLQARLYAFAVKRGTVSEISLAKIKPNDTMQDLGNYPASVKTVYLQLAVARSGVNQSKETEGCR